MPKKTPPTTPTTGPVDIDSILSQASGLASEMGMQAHDGDDEPKKKRATKSRRGKDIVISQPSNARHMLHVDIDFQWSGGGEGAGTLDLALMKMVGQGAAGRVFLAKHRDTGFTLAVKSITMVVNSEAVESLRKEIDMLKRLRSENIVSYFGSALRPDGLWVLMEYCTFGSVGDKINRLEKDGVRAPESDLAFILKSMVRGLHYLHKQLIAHRDIKAGNVLITLDGTVKLADFGTAAQASGMTVGGLKSFTGTPLFMSPEVLDGGNYGTKADIWSLGITAIQMADYKPPHFGTHPLRVIIVISSEPSPECQTKALWSDAFNDFVARCLAKEPTKRPTAEALLEHPLLSAVPDDYVLSSHFLDRFVVDWSRGYVVQATADIIPDTDDGLPLKEGDIANVYEIDEVGRLFGKTADGRSGWFSDFYTKRLKEPEATEVVPKRRRATITTPPISDGARVVTPEPIVTPIVTPVVAVAASDLPATSSHDSTTSDRSEKKRKYSKKSKKKEKREIIDHNDETPTTSTPTTTTPTTPNPTTSDLETEGPFRKDPDRAAAMMDYITSNNGPGIHTLLSKRRSDRDDSPERRIEPTVNTVADMVKQRKEATPAPISSAGSDMSLPGDIAPPPPSSPPPPLDGSSDDEFDSLDDALDKIRELKRIIRTLVAENDSLRNK